MSNIIKIRFHGGCHGCTRQEISGSYDVCKGCQYLNADWSLPNLNNQPKADEDLVRERLNGELSMAASLVDCETKFDLRLVASIVLNLLLIVAIYLN